MKNPHTPNFTLSIGLVHNYKEPGRFTQISMGLIRYSCSHISRAPMNWFPTNLGCGVFSSSSTNIWYSKCWNSKKSFLWRHHFGTLLVGMINLKMQVDDPNSMNIEFWVRNFTGYEPIRRRIDCVMGIITPAIDKNCLRNSHNIRGKVWMKNSMHAWLYTQQVLIYIETLPQLMCE